MAERRSLGDAMEMTPAKLAFIKGDSDAKTPAASKELVSDSEPVEKTIEVSLPDAQATNAKETRSRGPRRTSSRPRQENPGASEVLDQVLVSKTIRLPHRIAQALDRASLEQRLKYAKPYKQQEIAEEALTDWLAKSGYLD